ncbi:hypothetical protein SDC9_165410 [bioreactor metagenome]|uniref:Uncharacterized protein n=1 Tax=bioreactor metagenome TaxID=1076179 RepID=A0A645FWI1_9ZZZZ
MQFVLVQEAQVGGNPVAGCQYDDVARYEFAGIQLSAMSAAADGDRRRHAAGQRGECALGLGFLPVADQGIDQDDPEDDAGVDRFAKGGGDHTGGEQDQHQRLSELGGKALPCGLARAFG